MFSMPCLERILLLVIFQMACSLLLDAEYWTFVFLGVGGGGEFYNESVNPAV